MEREIKPINFNSGQLLSVFNFPKKEVDIWGRGAGKSSYFAWKIDQVQKSMPRATGVLAAATYKQILTRIIMPMIGGLERLGCYKDVHYVIGKKPDKKLGFREPFEPPLDYERFWLFKDGFGFHLSSQDREGLTRGLNTNFIMADELLTLNKKRLEDEVLATNRGGDDRFKKCPLNHGWHFASSMPTGASGSYLLDYSNYYEQDGNPIWGIWNKICRLQLKFIDSKSKAEQLQIIAELKKLYKARALYTSKEGILFSVSNVFDNLQNVSIDYIRDMRRQMTDISFRIEILNERMNAVEQCFYQIREEIHLYNAVNYHHIDHLHLDFEKLREEDSRMDADVNPDQPLDLGVDYGAAINSLRVCQEHEMDMQGNKELQYRYLKSIYVKYPQGLKDLAISFDKYYKHHRRKEVNLPYDHTAVGRDSVRGTYITELTKYLTDLGWRVNGIYIGHTPAPHDRFLFWQVLLGEGDKRMPVIRFNRTNDKEGILSMQLAGVIPTRTGFAKDKSTERSTVIPREQATDLSDAGDLPVWWRYKNRIEEHSSTFFEMYTPS